MTRIAIYPGTFDPITNGHIDLVRRALTMFDQVIVAVGHNLRKQPLFTTEERVEMAQTSLRELERVTVESFTGLTAQLAVERNVHAIIRGLRAVSDFEFEFQMALMNRHLAPGIETVYLMPNEKYTYLSSRMIKDVSSHGGDISRFVPEIVARRLKEKHGTPV